MTYLCTTKEDKKAFIAGLLESFKSRLFKLIDEDGNWSSDWSVEDEHTRGECPEIFIVRIFPATTNPKQNLPHDFDSSRTCNYCGIAAERVPGIADNAICPERVQ